MSGGITATEGMQRSRNSRQINIVLRQPVSAQVLEHPEEQSTGWSLPADSEYAAILKELDQMVGLDHVKDLIFEIYALLQIDRYRTQNGLQTVPQVFHMVFKGNPGTGKTTVARILARLFHSMEVLKKGHLIEAERADLVGEYIGHTAIKTRELIKKSLGGVLFVDEAYSLARGGEKDFGKEAIDCMVKAMEWLSVLKKCCAPNGMCCRSNVAIIM